MGSKNPKHGYIRCFSCSEPSTVHIMGEAKLLEKGEPPKNMRNTGRYYFVCPNCGTSQPKNSQERIAAALVDDVNQLPPIETSDNKALPVELVEPEIVIKPVIETDTETVQTVIDEQPEPTKFSNIWLWLGGVGALVLIFALINLFPKGGNHE